MIRINLSTPELRSNTAETGGTVLTSEYGVYEFSEEELRSSGGIIEIKLKSSSLPEHIRPAFPANLYFFFSEITEFFTLSTTLRHKYFSYDDCTDTEVILVLKAVSESAECSVSLHKVSSGETEADVALKDFECISAEGKVTSDEQLYNMRRRHNESSGRLILVSALPVFALLIFSVAAKLAIFSSAAFLVSFLSSAVYFARKNMNESFRKRFRSKSSDVKINTFNM